MVPIDPSTTLARVGQLSPSFAFVTLDGTRVSPAEARGKILVVHWFTLECPSCLAQLPYIENELWRQWQGDRFVFVAGVRDADTDAVRAFRDEHAYTMPLAPDAKREQFNRFATMHVPRTCVIDSQGIVAHHAAGFDEESMTATLDCVARLMR